MQGKCKKLNNSESFQLNRNRAKYMQCGKTVKTIETGDVFKLIENMDENSETVKGVNMLQYHRYELLSAWIRNWENNDKGFRERFKHDIEECKTEHGVYEISLPLSDIVPNDMIRFITPSYENKFQIKDFGIVNVNGEKRRAVYMDSTHFFFVDKSMNMLGSYYHICEFADICKKHNVSVELPQEYI